MALDTEYGGRRGLYKIAARVDDGGRHGSRHDPDGFGVGEAGNRIRRWRAVIGGLMFATAANMIFVPVVCRMLSRDTEFGFRQESK
jgi:hypothetical protein